MPRFALRRKMGTETSFRSGTSWAWVVAIDRIGADVVDDDKPARFLDLAAQRRRDVGLTADFHAVPISSGTGARVHGWTSPAQ